MPDAKHVDASESSLASALGTDGALPGRAEELLCACEVRVLVIDDDAATCQVIASALAHKDFAIQTVTDTKQVEDAVKSPTQFHLVLLDYVLPGLATEQVFTWLREFQPDASVIVITGYPSMEGALTSLRARTFDYITKPFQVSQLRQTVIRCLQGMGLLRMTEDALWEVVGLALRERRKSLGRTLADVAKRSNVSIGYLSQIELGKNSASVETLYRVTLALGMRMSELFAALNHE